MFEYVTEGGQSVVGELELRRAHRTSDAEVAVDTVRVVNARTSSPSVLPVL